VKTSNLTYPMSLFCPVSIPSSLLYPLLSFSPRSVHNLPEPRPHGDDRAWSGRAQA
jgi:hypothetical protein